MNTPSTILPESFASYHLEQLESVNGRQLRIKMNYVLPSGVDWIEDQKWAEIGRAAMMAAVKTETEIRQKEQKPDAA